MSFSRITRIGFWVAGFFGWASAGLAGGGAIKSVDFTPGKEVSVLVLNYSGKGSFRMFQNSQQRNVIVEADSLDLPASLTRTIDASAKDGPVLQVTPYISGSGGRKMAKFVVQLRQNAEAKMNEIPGRLVLEIRRKMVLAEGETKFNRRDELSTRASANEKAEDVAKRLVEVLDAPPEEKRYFGTKVTFEANNVDVHDVFRLVGDSSGLNIITDGEISAKSNFSLKDVPWDQVLDIVVQQAALKAIISGNVIRIITLEKYNKDQEEKMKQIAIGAELEPVIMSVIPLSFAKAEDMSKMISTLLVQKEATAQSGIDGANTDTINKINAAAAAANAAAVAGKAGAAGTVDLGLLPKISQDFVRGKIEVDARSNSLVVTNTKDAIERIRRLVKELDVALPQVMIDSKVIIATEDFTKRVGFDWLGKVTSSGTGRAGIGGAFNRNSVSLGNSDTTAPAYAISNPQSPAPIGMGIGFQLGTGRHGNLAAALQLAEANGVSKTVASPRIIVNNKVKAKIADGQTVYVGTSAGANSAGSLVPVTANLELDVTPQVTSSGSILMSVDLKKDAITSAVNSDQPTKSTKQIVTEVLVDNGNTLVLGGVYQFFGQKVEGGVPLLKNLPFLGQLFRDNNDTTQKSELMVFITPQIVTPTGYAEGPIPQ